MSKKTLKDFWKTEEEEFKKREEDLCQELDEKIGRIESRLEAVEERLGKIEILLDELKERGFTKRKEVGEIDDAMRLLKEKGFIRESKDLSKIRLKTAVVEKLKGLGAIEVRGSNDTFLVHPRKFEEFLKIMEETTESDPGGIGEKLGEMSELFNEMLRAGLIYFDIKEKRWKLIS